MPTVEQFISGDPDCAYRVDGFSGLVPVTSAAFTVNAVYYSTTPVADDWTGQYFGINQWGFAALPPGSVISSYDINFYGIYASSALTLSVTGYLGRMNDLTINLTPDLEYTTPTASSPSLTTSPQDISYNFPVTALQSATIVTVIEDFGFGLFMTWAAPYLETIFFDALTLSINYGDAPTDSDSSFRARGGTRSRLLWGVRE